MIIFIIFSWSYLFFICAAIPPESGIIIASLENSLRGDGFALSNSLMNFLGNFPPSYIFGTLSDFFKSKINEEDAKIYKHYIYSWMVCMAYNYIGVIFIIIAGIFRFKIKGDLSTNLDEEINDAKNIGIENDFYCIFHTGLILYRNNYCNFQLIIFLCCFQAYYFP